jgi:hypothetical protein
MRPAHREASSCLAHIDIERSQRTKVYVFPGGGFLTRRENQLPVSPLAAGSSDGLVARSI